MLQEFILLLLLAIVPASFSFFLDYCLGKPMSNEPNTKAVLFIYSYSFAVRKLKNLGLIDQLFASFKEGLNNSEASQRLDALEQFKVSVMLTAQKYFYWEQPLGMCPYCTNFWISLLMAFVMFVTIPLQFFNPFIFFLIIPIISHSILRKL